MAWMMGLFLQVGWPTGCMYLRTQLGPKQPKNKKLGRPVPSLHMLALCIIFHSFFVISTYGMKPISITFQPPSPPPFSALRLASNGENIGQAIIGLLYGYIARGAADSGSDYGDGPSERGGHFGSEPGAKLFDPAILDFGAAGIGRGMDGLGGRTDSAAAAAGLACVNFTIVFRGL